MTDRVLALLLLVFYSPCGGGGSDPFEPSVEPPVAPPVDVEPDTPPATGTDPQ